MQPNSEKSSVRISIILMILAFLLVYKLFVDKNSNQADIIYNADSGIINTWSNIDNIYDQTSQPSTRDFVNTNDELQSLEILQIPYKYITKWPDSIYIVYLDGRNSSSKSKVMYENSGNYKLINTEAQKRIDQVEWDEVLYINNPARYGKLVVFVVTKWDNSRLIQANKDDYYKYKKYIFYNLTN